jgi:hypothetical protein
MWKHHIPAKRTNTKLTAWLQTLINADPPQRSLIYVSCYQSRHPQLNFIFLRITPTANSPSQAWRTLNVILWVDYSSLFIATSSSSLISQQLLRFDRQKDAFDMVKMNKWMFVCEFALSPKELTDTWSNCDELRNVTFCKHTVWIILDVNTVRLPLQTTITATGWYHTKRPIQLRSFSDLLCLPIQVLIIPDSSKQITSTDTWYRNRAELGEKCPLILTARYLCHTPQGSLTCRKILHFPPEGSCATVEVDRCFRGAMIIAPMMETVRTFETSVNFNVTTQHYILEDSNLHTCRRENLISHRDYLGKQQIQFISVVVMGCRSRVSSVSTVSDYGLDDRTIGVRFPAEANDFSCNLCVQTGSGAHPASCTMGTGSPSPGVKRGRGVTLTTHPRSSAEVVNE